MFFFLKHEFIFCFFPSLVISWPVTPKSMWGEVFNLMSVPARSDLILANQFVLFYLAFTCWCTCICFSAVNFSWVRCPVFCCYAGHFTGTWGIKSTSHCWPEEGDFRDGPTNRKWNRSSDEVRKIKRKRAFGYAKGSVRSTERLFLRMKIDFWARGAFFPNGNCINEQWQVSCKSVLAFSSDWVKGEKGILITTSENAYL